ncbi:MAG: DUF4105 domain-containing protein, partial [Prevotellaceae bacterium]|nr:DUF4105 domain-containing protein [Prevotellaceae bacterium]
IYSLFGHTAIRYENLTRGTDVVFNYGIFNFDSPNFVLRFALGETDYRLGITRMNYFEWDYQQMGRDVRQQTLNLRQAEKERLVQLLEENYLPENRVYRYNFFYDNCATRPRDMIERAVDGRVRYADDMDIPTDESFRSIIYRYTRDHKWGRLGIDFCLGSLADRPITRREMMFVPFYVHDYFATAQIADDDGTLRPLVSSDDVIVETHRPDNKTWLRQFTTPNKMAWLLFLLVTGFTLWGLWRKRSFWALDMLLFGMAGIAGCLIAFLVFFSQHPTVNPNYLLIVFQPLHLLLLPWVLVRVRKRRRSRYLLANCAILTLFMLLWPFIPQNFNAAILPLAACLWMRSVNNLAVILQTRATTPTRRR